MRLSVRWLVTVLAAVTVLWVWWDNARGAFVLAMLLWVCLLGRGLGVSVLGLFVAVETVGMLAGLAGPVLPALQSPLVAVFVLAPAVLHVWLDPLRRLSLARAAAAVSS